MKIRFAVLSALILASVVACSHSPTASNESRRGSPATFDAEATDTTGRGGGTSGTGH